MQVFLEAIKFNHDRTFLTTGALNIRRNETETVTVPEWQRTCVDPECSPVAYANDQVPATITIKAKFSCFDASVARFAIKAVDINVKSPAPPGFRSVNVLGDVEKRDVVFSGGQSDYEIFELKQARFSEAGTSASDNIWLWQFSLDSRNWTDFAITKHRIYTLPKLPKPPWQPRSNDSSNIHLPWTEVLEYACHWAAGLSDLDAASAEVTDRVFDLGKTLVTYQVDPSYAHAKFELTKFLALLKAGSAKQTLNCDDCATIVSTFSNILGCDLSQSSMGLGFGTNQILLIGNSYWNPRTFLFHAVAWKDPCLANDILFDACLKVDDDGQPGRPPQIPRQPTQIRFGTASEQAYRFRLVGAGDCDPIPHDSTYGSKRRELGRSYLGEGEITDESLVDFLKEHYSYDKWPRESLKVSTGESLSCAFTEELEFPNWQLQSCEHLTNEKFTSVVQALFVRMNEPKELFSIDLYECSESQSPNDFILQLLARFEQLNVSRLEYPTVGELAFVEADGLALLFRRGRFVGVVRNAGRLSRPVIELAVTLDHYLAVRSRGVDAKSGPTRPRDLSISMPAGDQKINSLTQEINQSKLEEKTMHRFAYRWTNYKIDDTVVPPSFVFDGYMDLTTLDDNGILTNGYYEDAQGNRKPITGKVNEVGAVALLQLFRTDGFMRWEGLLVFDHQDRMKIAGKRFTPQFVKGRADTFTQVEDPWIITKP